jgi:ABC-type spermidine/putrescine transport system permease subunit II
VGQTDTYASVRRWVLCASLIVFYIFLYSPILSVVYTSFSSDIVWPFPFEFSLDAYTNLLAARAYKEALANSIMLATGAATVATFLATLAAFAVLRYPSRLRLLFIIIFVSPLFVADLLVGIATLVFNKQLLGLSGNIGSAILANAAHGFAFAFLVIVSQLVRHNWQLEEAAKVLGATPPRVFLEITLPTIWPSLVGGFLATFLLAFNNLDISFYNLGAIPVLPTLSWGSLRYGLKPELFGLSTLVNAVVLVTFIILYVLMQRGIMRFGYREQ